MINRAVKWIAPTPVLWPLTSRVGRVCVRALLCLGTTLVVAVGITTASAYAASYPQAALVQSGFLFSSGAVTGAPGDGSLGYPDLSVEATVYVDSSGAAHVAWLGEANQIENGMIDECTVRIGARSCGAVTQIPTTAVGQTATGGYTITSLKYLVGEDGAYLVAVIDNDENLEDETASTWVWGPNLPAGGFEASAQVGDEEFTYEWLYPGNEIVAPGDSGLDVVGVDFEDSPYDCAATDVYEFESFGAAGSGGPPTVPGGVQNCIGDSTTTGGPQLAGVTILPQGQTAVLGWNTPGRGTGTNGSGQPYPVSPLGMYVQPAIGGAFGSFRPLGVSGSFETDSTPSGPSWLLNDEPTKGDSLAGPLELYDFRGTSLVPVATIGANYEDQITNNQELGWGSLPPTNEDVDGNFYAVWTVWGFQNEGCAPANNICLIGRRVTSGGVLGPDLALDGVLPPGASPTAAGAERANPTPIQVAANASGVAWALELRFSANGSSGLYAIPFPSAATVTVPVESGTGSSVDVSCAGSSTCLVTGQFEAVGRVPALALRGARKIKVTILGKATLSVKPGKTGKLKLKLNSVAVKQLRKAHSLKVKFVVTEKLRFSSTPVILFSKTLTFHYRR